jgi:hypothetical protein
MFLDAVGVKIKPWAAVTALLIVVGMCLTCPPSARADTWEFTFELELDWMDDAAGLASDKGITIGDKFNITFLYNFGEAGYEILPDGSKEFKTDGFNGGSYYDYYYAKMLTPTLMDSPLTPAHPSQGRYYGFDLTNATDRFS